MPFDTPRRSMLRCVCGAMGCVHAAQPGRVVATTWDADRFFECSYGGLWRLEPRSRHRPAAF
ncbi:hypothetical protein [Aeromicrobium sp. PE09-221]|uniref:hypothetical protein n=1 Tax=Aeromicrobium sp. PE09-221 TaxID=1898043 RepID=UPI0011224431|nr:hypothetical protein [Aeromicrobium sp. PE09-221]